MFEQYVQQLNHPNADKRREAILWLGKSGDPRALKPLATAYKTDPVNDLRELALKAGRYIQKVNQERGSAALPPSDPPTPSADSESHLPDILKAYTQPAMGGSYGETPPPPVSTTHTNTNEGNSNLPDILRAYTKPQGSSGSAGMALAAPSGEGQRERATGGAGGGSGGGAKAIPEIDLSNAKAVNSARVNQAKSRLNSAFTHMTQGKKDEAVLELARALMINPGLVDDPGAQGLATSLSGMGGKAAFQEVLRMANAVPPKTTAPSHDREFWDMILSGVILLIVIALFSIVFFYGSYVIQAYVEALVYNQPLPNIRSLFVVFPLNMVLPWVLRLGALTLGSTFFQFTIVYAVATLMMGGTGSMIRHLRVSMNVAVIGYISIMIGFAILIGAVTGYVPTSLANVGLLMLVGSGLGTFILQAFLLGRVHEFGAIKGAYSVILGSIGAGIIAGLLGMFRPQEIRF